MDRSRHIIITLIIIILILIIALVGAMAYIFMNNESKNNNTVDNNSSSNIDNEIESNNEVLGDTEDESKILEIESFNAIFESYEGTELSSSQIKALLSQIEINNTTAGNEHIINLNDTGVTSLQDVEDNKKYNIEFSYDDEGYINEVTITDTSGELTKDKEKLNFNTTFNAYLGNITGERLYSLLQTIQDSNSQYPEHQITLSSNNLQDLNGIVATDIYIITLSYDTDGYVSNINIDKKI